MQFGEASKQSLKINAFTTQKKRKVDDKFFVDDMISDNTIIVTVNNKRISENGLRLYDNVDPSFFPGIPVASVYELTHFSSDAIRRVAGENYATLQNLYSLDFQENFEIDIANYNQIFKLELFSHDKSEVYRIIAELETRDEVLFASPEESYVVRDDGITYGTKNNQWGIVDSGINEAWKKSTGSSQVRVGVIDSGIDSQHPDLLGNIDVSLSRNFGASLQGIEEETVSYSSSHGTHVAGIIGAKGNNGIGVNGVNWDVSLVSLRNTDDRDVIYSSKTIAAISYCAAHNIPIINNSQGGYCYDASMKAAIKNYSGLFIASAGNDGKDTDLETHISSCYNDLGNLISVGAYGQKDDNHDAIAVFSNYGKKSVDLFAPGVDILSTIPLNEDGKLYDFYSGTSMAAPFVTGYAALLKSRFQDMCAETLKANILASVKLDDAFDGKCTTGGKLCANRDLKYLNTIITNNKNGWDVKVLNPTDCEREIVYNEKMAFSDDAKNWKNLSHIKYFSLGSGESKIVHVDGNGTATDIAFSYITNDTRYITFSNELSHALTLHSSFSTKPAHDSNYLSIVGKYNNKWIMRLRNKKGETLFVKYNRKMCSEGDANNWNGDLKHVSWFSLDANKCADFEVEENGTATCVALCLVGANKTEYLTVNNLNTDTTMSIHANIVNTEPYLELCNEGKLGNKWLIKVYNPFTFDIHVEYNSKMCFKGDAEGWTNNLTDKGDSFTLPGGLTKNIEIETNGFATCVVFSHVRENKRWITYADCLSNDGSLHVVHKSESEE